MQLQGYHLKYKYSRRNNIDKITIIGACGKKPKRVNKSYVQAKSVRENTYGTTRNIMKKQNKKTCDYLSWIGAKNYRIENDGGLYMVLGGFKGQTPEKTNRWLGLY